MKNKFTWLIYFLCEIAFAQKHPYLSLHEGRDRCFFIENKGQWHEDVLFFTKLKGVDIWITKYGINYTLYKLEQKVKHHKFSHQSFGDKTNHHLIKTLGQRIIIQWQNAISSAQPNGLFRQSTYYNYFIGSDPSKYATNVCSFKEVIVKNVYHGIDIRYYFEHEQLRYDFIVHPWADPSQIHFTVDGSDNTYLNNYNNLVLATQFGNIELSDLYVYQSIDKKQVKSSFVCSQHHVWKINVGSYDTKQDLIIDPLIYSTFIGGGDWDEGTSIALDASHQAYITGNTYSLDYDIKPGAFQSTKAGSFDVFITKLNASGTDLIYSTYIGGDNVDYSNAISLGVEGSIYIAGYTMSSNYPTTTGAWQTTHGGGTRDIIITKLHASGISLLYSTYLGGNDYDEAFGLAVDSLGNAFVTGYTFSSDFETTIGAFQTSLAGSADAFITKFNSNGNLLLYSTFVGGDDGEEAHGIVIDKQGNAFITGFTGSSNFPTSNNAFQKSNEGAIDVFVTKLHFSGATLVYSTFMGGEENDLSLGIDIDNYGNAYITGTTSSSNFDITPNAFQSTYKDLGDVFLTKINETGSALLFSTYLGGSVEDIGLDIKVSPSGIPYLTGQTNSPDFSVTANAFQTTFDGGSGSVYATDAFVTTFNNNASNLLYSTFIGGSMDDFGAAIALDTTGNAYITGSTYSNNFDISSNAFQVNLQGTKEIFVSKFNTGTNNAIFPTQHKQRIFVIYPNPANHFFAIQYEDSGIFDLLDENGNLIDTFTISINESPKTFFINIPAGFYFIRERKSCITHKITIKP